VLAPIPSTRCIASRASADPRHESKTNHEELLALIESARTVSRVLRDPASTPRGGRFAPRPFHGLPILVAM